MLQMAALNWLTLMIFFIMILLMFNSMNHYLFSYKPSTKTFEVKTTKMVNWKW